MTYRDLINEVLIRLREETISTDWSGNINDSSTVTDYQKVIGSLVNDSKRNVEAQHDWLTLRETFTISTVSGTMQYILGDTNSGAGTSFKVLDVINKDTGNVLNQANNEWINKKSFPSANIAVGEPTHYGFNGSSSVVSTRENDMNIDLYPVPNSAQDININIVKRQDTLKAATDIVRVPSQVVMLGAWARAISERGEDGGTNTSIAAAEVADALNLAIMLDSGNTEYENDWYIG